MTFGIRVDDAEGGSVFDSNGFLMRTVFSTVAVLSGQTATVSLPGFDPAKGLVQVTFYNDGLPDYIPLPKYKVLGSYPNARVEIYRRFSGQLNQPMAIMVVHYK